MLYFANWATATAEDQTSTLRVSRPTHGNTRLTFLAICPICRRALQFIPLENCYIHLFARQILFRHLIDIRKLLYRKLTLIYADLMQDWKWAKLCTLTTFVLCLTASCWQSSCRYHISSNHCKALKYYFKENVHFLEGLAGGGRWGCWVFWFAWLNK